MASPAQSSSSPQTSKYVPPWRRSEGAKPAQPPPPPAVQTFIRHYSVQDIMKAIPGPNHVFVRRPLPTHLPTDSAHHVTMEADDTDVDDLGPSMEFCRIMVFHKAHLNPPTELWTRNNIELLESNAFKPIPLFQERASYHGRFEFKGYFHIVDWEIFEGGSPEVEAFIKAREEGRTDKMRETWAKALSQRWAKVELRLSPNSDRMGSPLSERSDRRFAPTHGPSRAAATWR